MKQDTLVVTPLGRAVIVLVTIGMMFWLSKLTLSAADNIQVYVSFTTGECTKIVYKGEDYQCLKDLTGYKYEVVHVK